MNPTRIRGGNFVFMKPPSMPDCMDLVVLKCHDDGNRPLIQSAWTLDEEELAGLKAGHPLIVSVWGHELPPFALGVCASPYTTIDHLEHRTGDCLGSFVEITALGDTGRRFLCARCAQERTIT